MTVTTLTSRQTTIMTERVFRWWNFPIFIALTIASWSALAYFLSYWFSLRDWAYYSLPFAIMATTFLLAVFIYQMCWLCLLSICGPRPTAPRPSWKVDVATTFVPGAESIKMLEETLRAFIAMDYPHETWVLDKGDDDQARQLCHRLGAYHFSRKYPPQYRMKLLPAAVIRLRRISCN